MKWYLIKTTPGREKRVKERIDLMRSRDGMEEIEEVIIPTRSETRTIGDTRRAVETAAFPGYVMVRMEMSDDGWETVRKVIDVRGFVGYAEDERNLPIPEPMSDAEINQYLDSTPDDNPLLGLQAGDTVRITEGPFDEMLGVVVKTDGPAKRLTVEVNVFGRATPIDLHATQAAKV